MSLKLKKVDSNANTYDFAVPSGTVSGDTITLFGGAVPVHVLKDRDADGNAPCIVIGTVITESVQGIGPSANEAIAAGDIIYRDGSVINADNTNGTAVAIALAAVASGATTTIDILLRSAVGN